MDIIQLKDKKFRLYIGAEKIAETIKNLANRINTDFKDKNPLFLVVLNGSFMFASDLLKEVDLLCEISFVKLSSYHTDISSGIVDELIGLNEDVKGRYVIVIEDIVDTGLTIAKLNKIISEKGAKEVSFVSFLFKPESYKKQLPVSYVGIEIQNDFVVGYGLDYIGYGRNLKEVYIVTENN